MSPNGVDHDKLRVVLQQRHLNLAVFRLMISSAQLAGSNAVQAYREIEVGLARHDQALRFDTCQAAGESSAVAFNRKPWLPDEGDVAGLPGVQERNEVVGVPCPEESAFPFGAQEVVEGRVLAVHEVPVLAEPLPKRGTQV